MAKDDDDDRDLLDDAPVLTTGGRIAGGLAGIKRLVLVDQRAIGRTPRSNLATYTGLFDHVRRSFAVVAGDMGVSGHIIGGLLSHVVPGVTGIYAHRSDPALVAAADRTAAEVARRLNLEGVEDRQIIPLKQRKRAKR